MKYRYIEPEVSGVLGIRTDLDSSVHPPLVNHLNFEFEGWLGDCLLESFPCFVMTKPAKLATQSSELTGIKFDDVLISKSELFDELYPLRPLPEVYWAKIIGRAGIDDFGLSKDFRLVVSEIALNILLPFGLEQALLSDYYPSIS